MAIAGAKIDQLVSELKQRPPEQLDALVELFVGRLEALVKEGVERVPDDLDYDIDTITIFDPTLAAAIARKLDQRRGIKPSLMKECRQFFGELMLESYESAIDLYMERGVDGADASTMREWAQKNDVQVGARGRVGDNIRNAYNKAGRERAETVYAAELATYDARRVVTGDVSNRKERYPLTGEGYAS